MVTRKNLITLPKVKNVFRGKVKMFCFTEKTYTEIAENVSAIFLCPDFTPETASCEEQMLFSTPVLASLSGDTPADVLMADEAVDYQINPECADLALGVSNAVEAEIDACIPENINSEDVITITSDLSEDSSPVFRFLKHVPPGFYITVCNGDYLLLAADEEFAERSKYCCSVMGFVPSGMKLKIVIQSFNL